MRIYWHETKQQAKEFTSKLLKWWIITNGGELVGPDKADIICVSFCSPREIGLLSSARKIADTRGLRLLAGGPESYTGSTYLAWADYICVGEGYRLLASLADLDRAGGIDLLHSANNVIGYHNVECDVIPDYFIPWKSLPPVQTSNRYLLRTV